MDVHGEKPTFKGKSFGRKKVGKAGGRFSYLKM